MARVTISDIARAAQVSRGTVDKVIHQRPGVSDEVRARVKAVMQRMEYRPNMVARALKASARPLKLALLMPRLTNAFFAQVKAGMDDGLAAYGDYGLQPQFHYSDPINLPQMLDTLGRLADSGVDGIALRAIQSRRLKEKMDELAGAGIPVVVYDSDISGARKLCFIGENPDQSGRMAGSLMAKMLRPGQKVAVINGSPELSVHQRRLSGFFQVAEQNGLDIAGVADALEQRDIAYRETRRFLEEHADLRGLFTVAGCRTDVCRAVCDAGLAQEIRMVCYNYTEDIIPYIKQGVIDFAISTEPMQQGRMVIQALVEKLVFAQDPPKRHLQTPVYIGIDQNV